MKTKLFLSEVTKLSIGLRSKEECILCHLGIEGHTGIPGAKKEEEINSIVPSGFFSRKMFSFHFFRFVSLALSASVLQRVLLKSCFRYVCNRPCHFFLLGKCTYCSNTGKQEITQAGKSEGVTEQQSKSADRNRRKRERRKLALHVTGTNFFS